jgi:hypothetical protein
VRSIFPVDKLLFKIRWTSAYRESFRLESSKMPTTGRGSCPSQAASHARPIGGIMGDVCPHPPPFRQTHQVTWQVYYGDMGLGSIGERAGVPVDVAGETPRMPGGFQIEVDKDGWRH